MTFEPSVLFTEARRDEPQRWHVSHLGLDYPGEVIVAQEWRDEWGTPLEGDVYFRLVLFLEPQDVTEVTLRDPRIAVCLPDLQAVEEATRLGQEQQVLRETQATYLASPSTDLLRLARALEEEGHLIARRAQEAYLLALAQGSLITAQGQARIQERVGEPTIIAELVEELTTWLLATAYPSLPLDPSAFPSALTPDQVEVLYAGLTGQRGDSEAQFIAQAFGPGLGLCDLAAPLTLTPHQSPGIALVRQALAEGGGRVAADPFLHHLAHEQGLTYPPAILYLLLYLFSSGQDLELSLVPGHPLRLVNGTQLLGDALYSELVPDLAWPSDLKDWVRILGATSSSTWRSTLPWTRVLLPQAAGFLSPGEEADQEQLLVQRLQEIGAGLQEGVAAIEGLAELMWIRPPQELQQLGPLEEVYRAQGLQEFLAVTRRIVGGPLALQRLVEAYQRVHRISGSVPHIRATYTYLRECSDLGKDLDLHRLALMGQLDLSGLLQDPSLWDRFETQFDSFQRQYAGLYADGHTKHQRQVASLQSQLAQVETQFLALEQFNTLADLGPPLGAELPHQVREILASMEPCPVSSDALGLDAHPFCAACHFQPGDQPPAQEVASLATAVHEALQGQNQRLSSAAIRRILAHSDQAMTDQFVQVVQSSDLTALAQVLDPRVMEFLRRFLREV